MPSYSKLIVYYFSGTGNSANVARWMSEIAQSKNMQIELINIAHINRLQIQTPSDNALVAFCSPVHGFNYPPVMQKFIRRFPKGKNPVLLLNTRAGMLIGKWITPGLSGQCPVKAIKPIDNRPFWTFKCESCMHCMSYCPHRAIETAHGPILVFVLLFSLLIWTPMEFYFGKTLHLDNSIVNFMIQSGLMLVLLAIWYRIFHFLLRYKWFNTAITFTSLTFYKFWGRRYKALKNF